MKGVAYKGCTVVVEAARVAFKVARSLLKLHDRCTVVVEAIRLFLKQHEVVSNAHGRF